MRPFRAGVGLLANNLAIPVVPMRIDGLFELKRAGKKFARPWQVKVKIGSPIQFPGDSDPQWIAGRTAENGGTAIGKLPCLLMLLPQGKPPEVCRIEALRV